MFTWGQADKMHAALNSNENWASISNEYMMNIMTKRYFSKFFMAQSFLRVL